MRPISLAALIIILSLPTGRAIAAPSDPAALFHEQIAPLLITHCVECHNPTTRKGGLSIETLADMLKGGEDGPALIAGKPADSPLYTKLLPAKPGDKAEMPKRRAALASEDAEKIRQWIAAGAPWPKSILIKERAKADKSFWSFQPLTQPAPPDNTNIPPAWRANPIDRFIFAKLREKNLEPSPASDARSFIRRATYDLTGLPPTPAEIETFLRAAAVDRTAATSALIDRLLASPAYGEHWGRHWLDVVRFGESRGFERNQIITNLWPFRDYIIKSLNDDKPFNQLIREHLAGDVIGRGDPAVEVGAAFLVAGPYDDVGNQDAAAAAQIRADTLDEMVRATGEAFLGLTIGCARCHDHKFDPIATRDYYALSATFAGVVHGERHIGTPEQLRAQAESLAPLQKEEARFKAERAALDAKLRNTALPEAERKLVTEARQKNDAASARIKAAIGKVPAPPKWWLGTRTAGAGPFNIFIGGSPQKRGDSVTPASLVALADRPGAYKLEPTADEADRRLALANWIAADGNPLTPRVLANRLWHYHIGQGIVDTPSDFGYMGGRPSHPELLDFLAKQLIDSGWRIKAIHRLIMTSQTYQQSSAWRESSARADADSRLLWRFPPRRLAAEEIRDTLLAVSGKLDPRAGGPGFRLFDYQQDNVATYIPLDTHGPETYRRAVYTHTARAARVDVLTDFDAPDPALSEPRRASTTTPRQALTLLNHKFSLDMATAFADRLKREAPDGIAAQIHLAYVLSFSRPPAPEELTLATAAISQHGLRLFCRALLNSSELITVD